MLKLVNVTIELPVFVMVVVSSSVLPTYTVPKLRVAGVNFSAEAAAFTVCAVPEAVLLVLKLPSPA